MTLGDDDLPVLLEEQGVPVVLGGVATRGIKRRFTEEMLRDSDAPDLMSRSIIVSVKTDSLPSLESGASITVDGVPYTVRRRSEEAHGSLTRIHCVRVA